jgi:hypothetical protein
LRRGHPIDSRCSPICVSPPPEPAGNSRRSRLLPSASPPSLSVGRFAECRHRPAAVGWPRLHRWGPQRSRVGYRCCSARDSSSLLAPASSSFSSSVPWFFGPSLQPHYWPSALLRPLLTSLPLSCERSPQVRCRICLLVPTGSTGCVLMILGLCCSGPTRRPHPASLPVGVPTVEGLPSASFSFASRLRLAVRLRLPSSAPIGSFHPTRFCPCWAHPAAGCPTRPLAASPSTVLGLIRAFAVHVFTSPDCILLTVCFRIATPQPDVIE